MGLGWNCLLNSCKHLRGCRNARGSLRTMSFDGLQCDRSMRPSPIGGLAWASILAFACPTDMYLAWQHWQAWELRNWVHPECSLCHSMGVDATDPWDQVSSSPDVWIDRGEQPSITCPAVLQTDMYLAMPCLASARAQKLGMPRGFSLPFDGSQWDWSVRSSPTLAWCVFWLGRASKHSMPCQHVRYIVSMHTQKRGAPRGFSLPLFGS